jgi:FlaA1/EpsC-like NDP-sugar epimerase
MKRLRNWKVIPLITVDMVLVNLCYISAMYFRFSYNIPNTYINSYVESALVITFIYIICFYLFKLYKSLWTYASIDEFILSAGACIAASAFSIIYMMIKGNMLPFDVDVLAGIFSVLFICGFRMSFRICRTIKLHIKALNKSGFKKVLIIGAGSAGVTTINEMKSHPEMKYYPVALIDDNKNKIGTRVCGIKVFGNRTAISRIVQEKKVEEIIITIPTLSGEAKKEIIKICNETGCKVKSLPGVYELINEKVTLQHIRDVNVEDLLGREPITLDCQEISEYIMGKAVMVTGGGGSIGSELCRQISKFGPKELLILDFYENNAYDLQNELKYKYPRLNMKVLIASIRDKKRLEKIFYEFNPEVVFHAAAHKHVPLMEDNPSEAIKNNVFGTLNLAECADKYGTKRFVMISTDKAVNPTNVMGASKRICEMIIQAMDKNSRTEFVAVRFGNVLGSNGSVIPLFKRQVANGGPVTVTDENITRYFMTIPEAAQLVLQAGAYAKGGEIFVLDMGKPIKIYDLACDLIRLSGFEPHSDIKIEITGLRPGEKLYEEILMAEEGLEKTRHNKIFIGKPTFSDINMLRAKLDEMRSVIEMGSKEDLIYKIAEIVPTYKFLANQEVAIVKE